MMLSFRDEEEAIPQIRLDEFLDVSEDEVAETLDLEDMVRTIEQYGEGNVMMTRSTRSNVLRQTLTSTNHFEFDESGYTVEQMRSISRHQNTNICLFGIYATFLAIITFIAMSSLTRRSSAETPSTHPITMIPSNSTNLGEVEHPFSHKSNAIDLVCNVDFIMTKEGIDGCREACEPALCCFQQYSDHKCHIDVDCLLYSACKSLEYVSYSPFKFPQDAQIAIAKVCDGTDEQACHDVCHPSQCCFLPDYEPCKQSCFTYSPCKRLYDVTIPPQTSQEDHAPTGSPLSQMVQTQYNEEEPSPMQPETTTEQSFIPKQEISQPTDPFSAEVMCDALSIEADGGMSCRHKCDSLGCCASGNCRPNQVLDCKDFDFCIHAFPVKYKYFTI